MEREGSGMFLRIETGRFLFDRIAIGLLVLARALSFSSYSSCYYPSGHSLENFLFPESTVDRVAPLKPCDGSAVGLEWNGGGVRGTITAIPPPTKLAL